MCTIGKRWRSGARPGFCMAVERPRRNDTWTYSRPDREVVNESPYQTISLTTFDIPSFQLAEHLIFHRQRFHCRNHRPHLSRVFCSTIPMFKNRFQNFPTLFKTYTTLTLQPEPIVISQIIPSSKLRQWDWYSINISFSWNRVSCSSFCSTNIAKGVLAMLFMFSLRHHTTTAAQFPSLFLRKIGYSVISSGFYFVKSLGLASSFLLDIE